MRPSRQRDRGSIPPSTTDAAARRPWHSAAPMDPRARRERPSPRVARVTLATLLAVAALLCAFLAWATLMPGKSFEGALPPLDAREASHVGELRADVEQLAGAIGERNHANQVALERARDHVERALGAAGYTPRRLRHEVAGQGADNVEVELRGSSQAEEIVVVGAHYDAAMGAPGADDNASGVAALLALARAFHAERPSKTLRFVAFADEEPPYFWTETMGSVVYARGCKARGERVVAMLSLESLGYFRDEPGSQRYPFPLDLLYPSAGNFVAFVGNGASRGLVRESVARFRESAHLPSEGAALPGFIPGVGWSDQWSFWEQGYPALMVTDTAPFRNPHYHTGGDLPETLDYARLARVVEGLRGLIGSLAQVAPGPTR